MACLMIEMNPRKSDALSWVCDVSWWLTGSHQFSRYEEYLDEGLPTTMNTNDWMSRLQDGILNLDYPDDLPPLQKLKIEYLSRKWHAQLTRVLRDRL